MPYEIVAEETLIKLREKYEGKKIPGRAFSSGHTSQEGGWIAVDGEMIFFETDGVEDIKEQVMSLLGALLPENKVIPFSDAEI